MLNNERNSLLTQRLQADGLPYPYRDLLSEELIKLWHEIYHLQDQLAAMQKEKNGS